ncbi:MAG: YkvA family protein [Armatimonadota bacterium]
MNKDLREIGAILRRLPRYGKLVWLLLSDPRLSALERAALTGAAAYSISPIDAIPGVIPVIGQLDDLAILLYTVRWVLRRMPTERAEGYLARSGLTLQTLESDLGFTQRTGTRILRRAAVTAGITLLALWGLFRTRR